MYLKWKYFFEKGFTLMQKMKGEKDFYGHALAINESWAVWKCNKKCNGVYKNKHTHTYMRQASTWILRVWVR